MQVAVFFDGRKDRLKLSTDGGVAYLASATDFIHKFPFLIIQKHANYLSMHKVGQLEDPLTWRSKAEETKLVQNYSALYFTIDPTKISNKCDLSFISIVWDINIYIYIYIYKYIYVYI